MQQTAEAIEKSEFKKNLFILETLVGKDFKLRYRRSVLGVAWSVLNPLLMMVVLTAVFSFMFRFSTDGPYALYLILGMTLFSLMSDSTQAAMNAITDAAPLIKKIRIEKLLFPIESVAFQVVSFTVSLIAVAIVFLYFKFINTSYDLAITFNLLLIPLLVIYVMLFSLGLGFALSALSVFFRDIKHLWGVVITAWTYATPLFWTVDYLPDWMMVIEQFNPMFHYVTYYRNIVMWSTTPSLAENAICLAMALITFAVGYAIFRKSQNKFILHI